MPTDERTLAGIFNDDEPLGPTHLQPRTQMVEELLVRENKPFLRSVTNPSFLIGRKGSGKSSLLYGAYLRSDTIQLELPSDDMFFEIIKIINSETSEYTTVEQVESIWTYAIWSAIAVCVAKYFNNQPKVNLHSVNKFIFGMQLDTENPPFLNIKKALEYLLSVEKLNLEQAARYTNSNGVTAQDVETEIVSLLRDKGLKLRVLVDSLELYQLDQEGSFPALSGFIRFIGEFETLNRIVHIQCALPAEVYFPITEFISTNPFKDFGRAELVHWTAGELLFLAAKRLSIYIRLNSADLYDRIYKPLEKLSPRAYANKFWDKLLPPTIKNGLKIEERTAAYILRHTALSPRHILQYMNEIMRLSKDNILNGLRVERDVIIRAVKTVEVQVCADIFAGWRNNYEYEAVHYRYHGYKQARELCELLLPHLTHKFRYEEFRRQYDRSVADAVIYINGPKEALRVLTEVGVIGRVVYGITKSNRYIEGEFEYGLPSRLRYTVNSEFCLHPAFIGTFGIEEKYPNPPYAIYPRGSDPDDPDLRESH